MKKIVTWLILATLLISGGKTFAQKDGFSLHLSGVFPNGKFGEFDDVKDGSVKRIGVLFHEQSKTGAAGTGFGLGFKYQLPIPKIDGLRFLVGAELMYNPLCADAKEHIDEIVEAQKSATMADRIDINTTLPNYLNIPLMAGLNCSFGLTDRVKLYGEFGVGLNVRIATKFMLEIQEKVNDYNYEGNYGYTAYERHAEGVYEYDNATSFAYQLGVGILFNRVSIGLHWYNLGSAKVKGKVEETISVNDYISGDNYYNNDREVFTWKKLSTSMLTLTVGYHF